MGTGSRIERFSEALPDQGRGGPFSWFRGDATPISGTVVLVPDVMGSTLMRDGTLVWPNPAELVSGVGNALASADLAPAGLVDAYQPMRDYLGGHFEVQEYPYDGRRHLSSTSGPTSRPGCGQKGARRPRPVHLMGHGAGGAVIVRALERTKLRAGLVAARPERAC